MTNVWLLIAFDWRLCLCSTHTSTLYHHKCAENNYSFPFRNLVAFFPPLLSHVQYPSSPNIFISFRNKDRATHPITSVKPSTSRQTCASNINTSDPHYSSQEQPDSCYEIGWQCLRWVFASETAQRNLKLTQFADGVLSKAIDFFVSFCNSLTRRCVYVCRK